VFPDVNPGVSVPELIVNPLKVASLDNGAAALVTTIV
jgi:hypothetical protein